MKIFSARASLVTFVASLYVAGCAPPPRPLDSDLQAHLPLLQGWFDGQAVFYVTTDVSDAGVAEAKGANFVPRLGDALPSVAERGAGRKSAVDKVYALTNFEQGSVFASAPTQLGYRNTDSAYSPLWQLVRVTWQLGKTRRVLTGEEAVLRAAEQREVSIEVTRVVP